MPNLPLRNHVARSPLLRKGGVHMKKPSSQRQTAKTETRKHVQKWFNEGKSNGHW